MQLSDYLSRGGKLNKFHSFLTPKSHIKRSKIGGHGVFAKSAIKKGELISIWGGVILTGQDIDKLGVKYPNLHTHPLPVFDNYYLGPIDTISVDDAERFNHSCDANAGIKGQIILVARRHIRKGEEICFDYETTETIGESFICKCNKKNCRKKIDGNSWKEKSFQRQNRGYFSWYIEEKIKKLKKSHKE